MRNAIDVRVQEVIIHILDPQGDGLVLSDLTLPLGENAPLTEYFARHIQATLQDPTTQAARFRNINPEQPSGICEGILSGRIGLVDGSRGLAEALYRILERDRRISAADLGVCRFEAKNYPGERNLALLKIDPSQVFRHVVRQDNRGNIYVSFEAEPKAFTNERLQKSAFVHRLAPRHPDYDMLLLDRQVRGQEDRQVARFFSESFLDAQPAFDPHEYTSRLYKGLLFAQNRLRPDLTAGENDVLDDRIRNAITSERINIDQWLADLPLPEEHKQTIDRIIAGTIPDREFDLDRAFSTRLVQKVKYTGDYNLKVELSAADQAQVLKSVSLISNDPVRPPFYRIVIETEKWTKVS